MIPSWLGEPETLWSWFEKRVRFSRDEPAMTFGDTTRSFGELHARSASVAALLYAQGVRKGDRVGYLDINNPDFLTTLFAVASIGAIFVPLNCRLTSAELRFQVADADLAILFVGPAFEREVAGFSEEFPSVQFIATEGGSRWPSLGDLIAAGHPERPTAAVAADDVAVIFYTSGTTGQPKGAMLTHANLWANNLNWTLAYGLNQRDILLTTAPMFHVSGLFVLLSAVLMAGGRVILHAGFEPDAALDAISRHGVTVTFSVPTMLLAMTQSPQWEATDFTALRSLVVGGAPTPETLLRIYGERGVAISHCYGMTETVTASTVLMPEEAMTKLNSVGRAMFLSEIALIDDKDQEIHNPDVIGEIAIRGRNVFKGYWNRPDATAGAFFEGGWFRSGDIGSLDADGYLYVRDRKKDMIISGGENIYAAEIESVLLEHPQVASAAVVGKPDPHWGETVVAFLVLKSGAALTIEELRAFCGGKLARYKLPRHLAALSEMPLNGSGKIVKQQLRDLALELETENV